MRHLAKRIGSDLSKYWKIKFDRKKCANMFDSDWISCGKVVFHLYADNPCDFSSGSVIIQGWKKYDLYTDVPRIRLVLDDSGDGINYAIIPGYISPEIIDEKNILKTIAEMYNLSYRGIVTFGKKLKLLNISIV